MGKTSTLLFTFENIFGNQASDLNEINYEFDALERVLDEFSEDPPDFIVNNLIEAAKKM